MHFFNQGIAKWWTFYQLKIVAIADFDALMDKYWNKDFGERQEIVFIGLKFEMDEKNIRERIPCLIKKFSIVNDIKALIPSPYGFSTNKISIK